MTFKISHPLTLEQSQLLELFKKRGALLTGHFVLSSGLHSNTYLQSALLLQDTELAEELAKLLADQFPGHVETVVSPALGGIIIGHEVARAKRCRSIFVEKDESGIPVLRRGFELSTDETVLVIEDVITTGRSTLEVIDLVKQAKADLIGLGSLVIRSQNSNEKLTGFNKPIHSLLTIEVENWDPASCPLCQKGIPGIKPGSRKT